MVLLWFNFPLHLRALHTQDDISFASPLHSVHMKYKIRAVTWSFMEHLQRRFYIFTLLHYFTLHLHIHILYTLGFATFSTFTLQHFTCSLRYFLLFTFSLLSDPSFHYVSIFFSFHWDSISHTIPRQNKTKRLNFICTWRLMVVWAVRLPWRFQTAPCLPSSACNIFTISLRPLLVFYILAKTTFTSPSVFSSLSWG